MADRSRASSVNFHQLVYDRSGSLLRIKDPNWEPIRFWFDACLAAAFPKDCSGLTYLDVGCSNGLYPLRFAQRGGVALGLNPSGYDLREGIASDPSSDTESTEIEYLAIRAMYPECRFSVIEGGFFENEIVPVSGMFDYVSCMNVLEYLPDPGLKVAALFEVAHHQVMVTTDINFGPTRETPEFHPLLRQVGLKEFESWSPWPCRVFAAHFPKPEGDFSQGVLIARRNGDFSDLPNEIELDMGAERSSTQIYHESRA